MGCAGQDGRLLWGQLAQQEFELVGLTRSGVETHVTDWTDAVDVNDAQAVLRLVGEFRPDHIYYLAAHHHSSQDERPTERSLWEASWKTHVSGFQNVLEAARESHPEARIFYAGSSRVFGNATVSPQNESTPFRPHCAYGVTKTSGMMLGGYYRSTHRMHVSAGILFNHESPLRGPQFVSQRVIRGLVGLKTGRTRELHVGDLQARVDWGYAPDYTRAMQLILEADAADDFVVASGATHSVKDLVQIGAQFLGIENWERCVIQDQEILQRGSQQLCGDASRLRSVTGWKPSVTFPEMIGIMTQAELERVSAGT